MGLPTFGFATKSRQLRQNLACTDGSTYEPIFFLDDNFQTMELPFEFIKRPIHRCRDLRTQDRADDGRLLNAAPEDGKAFRRYIHTLLVQKGLQHCPSGR